MCLVLEGVKDVLWLERLKKGNYIEGSSILKNREGFTNLIRIFLQACDTDSHLLSGWHLMHAFRSILLVVTHHQTSDLELRQVFKIALENRARLVIAAFDNSLETLQKLQFLPLEKKIEGILRRQQEEVLEKLKNLAWQEGIRAETRIVSGRPRQALYPLLQECNIDLVVKLAEPSGALTLNQLTGDDLALLRKCPVPVLMMADRNQLPDFSGKVMVAVDAGYPDTKADELNRKLVQYGVYLAVQEKSELHLVTVWNLPVGKRSLQTLSDEELYELQEITRKRYHRKLGKIKADVGISDNDPDLVVREHVLKGKPSLEIQRLANLMSVDLIVMGTLGHHRKGFLIGNTAENILNNIYCSILAVKPEGFVSPFISPE